MRCSLVALFALAVSACSSTTPATTSPPDAAPASEAAAPPSLGQVETFAELTTNSEGIALGAGPDAKLYVTGGNAVWSVSAGGVATKVADVPSPLGVALRKDGELVVCGKSEADGGDLPGVIWRVTPSGQKSVLVGPGAVGFKLTNFVVVAPDGGLVFSDSAGNKVFRANADGTGVALVTDAITYPNGMAFSPDGKVLYVASWSTKKLYALPRAADGALGAPEVYFEGVENVDGIVAQADGALLLVASGEGIVRVGADKKPTVIAKGAEFKLAANGAFGAGAFGDRWLYVTNLLGRHVSRVYVDATGAPLPPK